VNPLLEVLIFLVAAIVVVPICKRLGLSAVLGYLAAGLLIGPSGFGLIRDSEGVLHFAEIGVVLLLFIIGLELQPNRLWVMRRLVFSLGMAQVVVSSLVIGLLAWLLLGLDWQAAAVIGYALALSSTAFVLQLLGERRELNQAHGRAAFGVLLLQDVAVIPALAVLNLIASANPGSGHGGVMDPWLVLAVVAGLVAARFALRPVLRFVAGTGIHELFTAAGLALVMGAALAMGAAGLSMGLGAFIAGMMVADSEYRHQLETDVTPFKGLLLGLFFIAVGMTVNVRLLASEPLLILGLTLALVAVKFALIVPLTRWLGLRAADAVKTAAVLSQGGEFAFVLLTVAVSAALISDRQAELTILVVTLSMISTPFFTTLIDRWLSRAEPPRPFDDMSDSEQHPVVIAGFGRVGQIIGRVLSMRHIPFIALEGNPKQVDFVRQFGNEIYYGDATRLDSLRAAHVDRARAFVLTLDDLDLSLKIARQVRHSWPHVPIFARARNRHHELLLREVGVHFVMRDTLLSSLAITEELLVRLGETPDSAREVVATFRDHDRETLRRQAAVFHDEAAFRQTTRDAAAELKGLFQEDASAGASKS